MMAEELPAPRLGRGRLAEQAEDVAPLAHHRRPLHDVAEEAVELHHVARQLIAVRAHAGAQHRQHRVAQRFADFVEAKPVVLDIELGVLPVPPLVGAGRKARAFFCSGDMPASSALTASIIASGRRALGPRRKEIGDRLAAGGDAAERLVEHPLPVAEQLLGARACRSRLARARARWGLRSSRSADWG